jgi:hypothetical protein
LVAAGVTIEDLPPILSAPALKVGPADSAELIDHMGRSRRCLSTTDTKEQQAAGANVRVLIVHLWACDT